jgi:hypothetical protein
MCESGTLKIRSLSLWKGAYSYASVLEGRVARIAGNLEESWIEGTSRLSVSSNTLPLRGTLNQTRKMGVACEKVQAE